MCYKKSTRLEDQGVDGRMWPEWILGEIGWGGV
jgi:hypothetical protein